MPWSETTRQQYRRLARRFETDLTDAEWQVIEPLLPPPSKMGRPRSTCLREVWNAIQYMLGTGCQWRAIPPGSRRPNDMGTVTIALPPATWRFSPDVANAVHSHPATGMAC